MLSLSLSPCIYIYIYVCVCERCSVESAPRRENERGEIDMKRWCVCVCVLVRRFTKAEADFNGDEAAYNDYLETYETIAYNLINKIDVEEMEEKLREYEVAREEERVAATTMRANGGDDHDGGGQDGETRIELAGGYDERIVKDKAMVMLLGALR